MSNDFCKDDKPFLASGQVSTMRICHVNEGRPPTFEDAIDSVLADLRDVLIRKQHDYGPGNILDFGEYGVLVRANDKMARLKNLLKNGEAPANEALEDTWIDLANYGVIALLVRRGLWGLPMEGAHVG